METVGKNGGAWALDWVVSPCGQHFLLFSGASGRFYFIVDVSPCSKYNPPCKGDSGTACDCIRALALAGLAPAPVLLFGEVNEQCQSIK